jgi:glyoxylate reductase
MRPVALQELLARADFISLHVPLAADTRHLIGKRELDSMRPTAYLINTSRGPIVDEAALVDALRANRIAGAALDVYEREPEIHPGLRGLANVVTLPHVGSATLQTRIAMGMACVENVTGFFEGREPPNRVA